MFCYVKHFSQNDTDTDWDRLSNFWTDEQTIRELYLHPFEIAIKETRMTICLQPESPRTKHIWRIWQAVTACLSDVFGTMESKTVER